GGPHGGDQGPGPHRLDHPALRRRARRGRRAPARRGPAGGRRQPMSPIDQWLPANRTDAGLHTLRHVRPGAHTLEGLIANTQGLHRFYLMQETGGASAAELANGQTGTYNGPPTFGINAPVYNMETQKTAVQFSGTTQFLAIPTLNFTVDPLD